MTLKTLRNKYWLMSAATVLLHQLIQHGMAQNIPFVDSYLDAFLSIPVLLGLMLQERQLLIDKFLPTFRPTSYWFSLLEVVVATILLAVIFEELLPIYCLGYTRDSWDYFAYGLGAVFFYLMINRYHSANPEPTTLD